MYISKELIFLILSVLIICALVRLVFANSILVNKNISNMIQYLCKYFPLTVVVIVGIYSAVNSNMNQSTVFPQIIAVAITAALHIWKRNIFLSVFGGTIFYMILVQKGF